MRRSRERRDGGGGKEGRKEGRKGGKKEGKKASTNITTRSAKTAP